MRCSVGQFSKITAILRGYDCDQVDAVIGILVNSSISAVEITLNREDSIEMIARMIRKYSGKIAIGAGTVLSEEDLEAVVEAGVDFVLSPNVFTKEMLKFCHQHKVLSVPGAFSPTEVYQSLQAGADIVKIFPARTLGSGYFKDLQAPYGKLPLMAVGGIHAGNIREYFQAGASFVGIASGLFNKEDVLRKNMDGMKASLEAFQAQIEGI